MERGFRILEHTSETGVEAWGPTREACFAAAAEALFSVITDVATVRPQRAVRVSAQAEDLPSLLVAWLNELNFRSETEGLVMSRFDVEQVTETSVDATCRGEPMDADRHPSRNVVKSVTYHGVEVVPVAGGWRARACVDI